MPPPIDMLLKAQSPRQATSNYHSVVIASSGSKQCLDVDLISHVFEEVNKISRTNLYRVSIVCSSSCDWRDEVSQIDEISGSCETEQCTIGTLFITGPYEPEGSEFSPDFSRWLREQCSRSKKIVAVAGGTISLAALGLLDGLNIVCHWRLHEQVKRRYRVGSVRSDILYTLDKNVYTCAGALASVDIALRMVETDCGSNIACEVAHRMLVPYLRSGNNNQVSPILRSQTNVSHGISDLLVWLPENMMADLSVPKLARRVAMSPRNFARTFLREIGTTPAKYIEKLRLEAACREILRDGQTIFGATQLSGLKNNETLRRLFLRHMGITPRAYLDLHRRKSPLPNSNKHKADPILGRLSA